MLPQDPQSLFVKKTVREDLEEIREGMTEKVYHNLGCAYSYLFQMEKEMCIRDSTKPDRSVVSVI